MKFTDHHPGKQDHLIAPIVEASRALIVALEEIKVLDAEFAVIVAHDGGIRVGANVSDPEAVTAFLQRVAAARSADVKDNLPSFLRRVMNAPGADPAAAVVKAGGSVEPLLHASQARAWEAVWEALRKGNPECFQGVGNGLECAVREIERLQKAAK